MDRDLSVALYGVASYSLVRSPEPRVTWNTPFRGFSINQISYRSTWIVIWELPLIYLFGHYLSINMDRDLRVAYIIYLFGVAFYSLVRPLVPRVTWNTTLRGLSINQISYLSTWIAIGELHLIFIYLGLSKFSSMRIFFFFFGKRPTKPIRSRIRTFNWSRVYRSRSIGGPTGPGSTVEIKNFIPEILELLRGQL